MSWLNISLWLFLSYLFMPIVTEAWHYRHLLNRKYLQHYLITAELDHFNLALNTLLIDITLAAHLSWICLPQYLHMQSASYHGCIHDDCIELLPAFGISLICSLGEFAAVIDLFYSLWMFTASWLHWEWDCIASGLFILSIKTATPPFCFLPTNRC